MNDRAIYTVANATALPIGDKSVHMIATSPPYFGLRSYDTGDMKHAELGAESLHDCGAWARGDEPCGACYVCHMRQWGREMWRVLRSDGVMFLNLADSYAAGSGIDPYRKTTSGKLMPPQGRAPVTSGLKPKDLCGIPQRVVLALQADGWYWRSKITWCKTAPMPESVKDRPTNATEEIFLLTKSPRYFWDSEAVKETAVRPGDVQTFGGAKARNGEISEGDPRYRNGSEQWGRTIESGVNGRNLWNYWIIGPSPYSGAHYATWPPALVERMIRAGSSERGCCPHCGAPWRRVVDKGEAVNRPDNPNDVLPYAAESGHSNGNGATTLHKVRPVETVEWRPSCDHDAPPAPAVVLDPFAGSGTTLMVARQLGRIGLGFDLSERYLYENARTRLGHDQLETWGRGIPAGSNGYHELPLFALAAD
jgi:DNA modification methylase